MLWHEFCHVVTLHKTRNKMPRWLSEGISVYEERQADATWGQSMTPQYREIILSGKMTPVSQLSSAFLAPPSPLHLQFAYYESSLVVEYLVEQVRHARRCRRFLTDLGDGMEINEALIRHTAPLGRLDADFAKFARAACRSACARRDLGEAGSAAGGERAGARRVAGGASRKRAGLEAMGAAIAARSGNSRRRSRRPSNCGKCFPTTPAPTTRMRSWRPPTAGCPTPQQNGSHSKSWRRAMPMRRRPICG